MNVLLVDDHPLFGVGFAHALAHAGAGIEARTALTIDQGIRLAVAWPELDVVLVDYRLGADDGIAGLRRLGERFPLVARVLISGDEDPALAVRARAAGASGFLGKSLAIDAVVAALQQLARGETVFLHPTPAMSRTPTVAWPTARQMEVLALIARGRPNKLIADELGIAERTVKLHITSLLDTVGANNRTHLVVVARERGLL